MDLTITHVGSIDDNFVNNIHAIILNQPEPISSLMLNISSLGGSVIAGITAYNFLKQLPFPINAHNLGEVSSAALLPYLAGHIRTAEDVSKFLIHPVEINLPGNMPYFKVEELLNNIKRDIDSFEAIVAKEVPLLAEKNNVIDLLQHRSLVLSPADAKALGLVTV